MAINLQPLARLGASERRTIALLRGGCRTSSAQGTDPFTGLRATLKNDGVTLLAAQAPYVSKDELDLLCKLALAQRGRFGEQRISAPHREWIEHGADELTRMGIRLFYGAGARTSAVAAKYERFTARERLSTDRDARDRRMQALNLVDRLGSVTTREFADAGISRQYLSQLCSRGLLLRVRYGVYAPVRSATTIR